MFLSETTLCLLNHTAAVFSRFNHDGVVSPASAAATKTWKELHFNEQRNHEVNQKSHLNVHHVWVHYVLYPRE